MALDKERLATKHSIVLANWNATKSPTALKKQALKRSFEAAKSSRLNSGWSTANTKIDAELRGDLTALRARARDLSINNDYARKFLAMMTDNVVGPNGFTLQSQVADPSGKADSMARRAIETGFWNWSQAGECETSAKMSFADLCRLYIRTLARDGEVLVRRVRDKKFAFGYRLQMLDIDRLDILHNELLKSGNVVRMGVELDGYGAPVAYWLLKRHPGEYMQQSTGAVMRERILATEIFHNFIADRPEQTRGFPWMASAMMRMNMLHGYEEAAVVAARNGASKMGFFTSPDGTAAGMGDGEDDAGNFTTTAEAGTFDVIPQGYTFQQYNPDYPTQNYDSFVKSCLRGIASGLGISYNTLANDLEGVNFSSIRSGTLSERENFMVIQNWMIGSFMRGVMQDFLEAGLIKGAVVMPNGSALPAGKLDKFKVHNWQGRRWQWVDPEKDITASLLAIRGGLSTPQIVAAQMGLDIEDVIDALQQANEMALAAGLPAYCAPAPVPVAPAAPTTDPALAKAIADLQAEVRALPRERNVVIHNEQPAAPNYKAGDTNIHMPEGMVQLEATINTPEVVVSVPPAQIAIAHPSRSVQTIERDEKMEMTKTITTHEFQEPRHAN